MGYRPWGHRESDTTEQLSTEVFTTQILHRFYEKDLVFCNSQSMLMGSCLHRSWTVGDSCAFIPALDTEVTIKTRKLRGMMSELPGGAQLLPWALQECRVSFLPNTPPPTSPPPPHASHRACLFVFFPWSQKNLPKLTLVCVSSFHICCYP